MLVSKERKTDRIIELRPIAGKDTMSSSGLVDRRLFNGDNKLHAIMNTRNCNWSLKYEDGGLPGPLKQTFTSFNKLKDHVEKYFQKRNIEITNIID